MNYKEGIDEIVNRESCLPYHPSVCLSSPHPPEAGCGKCHGITSFVTHPIPTLSLPLKGRVISSPSGRGLRGGWGFSTLRTYTVPPTVIPSILIVGIPTPTGTDWPSLPHVPMPVSSSRSFPTIETFFSTSGPLPLSVAPLTGTVTFPSSIRYASLAVKTNLP